MREETDREQHDRTPRTGSAGDGGVVEAGGTLGGITASADGEIVRAPRNAPGTPAPESVATPTDDALDATGTDVNGHAEPPTGDIQGYEDLESDPGV
jgi:hypothetical protein